MSYNKTLQSNNTDLQAILNTINALPEAGGGELPVLTNPANASELLNGKELIDNKGKIITGSMPNNGSIALTMDGIDTKTISIPEGYTSGGTISLDSTIDEEVEEQTDLIEQIKNAANNLPEAGSSGSAETVTIVNNTGKTIMCGASQIVSGGSVQLPFTKSSGATQIPIMSIHDFGSMTATSTSGTVAGVYYDYVRLYINGTTTHSSVFCAMVYCTNITSGSTITIST